MDCPNWMSLVGLAAYVLLEWWLGRTPHTRAGSVLELLMIILDALSKGRNPVPEVVVSRKVSKETDEVLVLAAAVVAGLVAKKPLAELVPGLIPAIVKAMDGGEQIAAEFRDDPVVFCQTVGERLGEILGGLIAAKQS